MILYPAIDLFEGKAVRLRKGNYSEMTVYHEDPPALARSMAAQGADHLHLVDLEGARSGGNPNFRTVEAIAAVPGLFLELGGGIRSMETVQRALDCGVSRVILGTAAVEDEAFLIQALSRYGGQIAVGVDLKDGFVAVRGWERQSAWTAEAFLSHLTELGVQTVICTDISRDGILAGSNHALYRKLNAEYSLDLIASGGVSSAEDLRALRDIGMAGAILGRAYYSGAVTIPEALAAAGGTTASADGEEPPAAGSGASASGAEGKRSFS